MIIYKRTFLRYQHYESTENTEFDELAVYSYGGPPDERQASRVTVLLWYGMAL